jgi:hypothetical protein
MKVAISIVVAVVMPCGFLVLAGVILSRVLARRRQALGNMISASVVTRPSGCTIWCASSK